MRIEDYNHGAISPDGQRFVFEATVGGNPQLVVRDMASSALVVLTGTEGAWRPFWSPDSQSLAFFHPDGHLKQVVLPGRRGPSARRFEVQPPCPTVRVRGEAA